MRNQATIGIAAVVVLGLAGCGDNEQSASLELGNAGSVSVARPPLADSTPASPQTATYCATFAYGRSASGTGTSVFLDDIPDDGPFYIVISRSDGPRREDFLHPRFSGAPTIESDYPDIAYESVTGVTVSERGKDACTVGMRD